MEAREPPQDLVERARRGDREAFDELVGDQLSRVKSFIRTRLGESLRLRVEPEDVLQEALLKAFRSMERFEWRGEGSVFAWLGSVAEYVIRDLAREEGRRRPPLVIPDDVPAEGVPPSKAARRDERFDRLKGAFQSLSGDYREVIRLARIEGLPLKAIAERMERSPDAVRHLLLRALRKLREEFGDTDSFSLPPGCLGGEEPTDHGKETKPG